MVNSNIHTDRYYNRRILILGGSILQLTAILTAKRNGAIVGLVDINPESLGKKYVDYYFNVSTTDIEAVDEVFNIFKPDAIFTMATDMPMRVIGFLSDKYRLNYISYENSIVATDKQLMIERFKEFDVPHPKFKTFNEQELENIYLGKTSFSFDFPCIIKPVDSSGSRGVNTANSIIDLYENAKKSIEYSKSKRVIIEEIMVGNEVSVEIIVRKTIPTVIAITDKITSGYPHYVELSHSEPSTLSNLDQARIIDVACDACRSIGIINGAAHAEVMLTEFGPKMIEIGARLGGDFITSHLVPLSTSYNIVEAAIDISLNIEPKEAYEKTSFPTIVAFFTPFTGLIRELPDLKKIITSEVLEIGYLKNHGDIIDEIPSSSNRLGYFVLQSNSIEEARQKSKICLTKIDNFFKG